MQTTQISNKLEPDIGLSQNNNTRFIFKEEPPAETNSQKELFTHTNLINQRVINLNLPETPKVQTDVIRRDINIFEQKENWRSYNDKIYEHFKNQISVCSCIAYCDCPLHESLKNEISKLVLPGGKRDIAGDGRVKHKKYDESCWQAMKGEFLEEVNVQLSEFCQNNYCQYFDTHINDRIIRTYFLKISCEKIPSVEYTRFRFHESFRRTWVDLETIVKEFKFMFKKNKQSMMISPKMFQTIKQFGMKFVKKIIYEGYNDGSSINPVSICKLPMETKYKIFKITNLFGILNKNIFKYQYNVIQKKKFCKQIKEIADQQETFLIIVNDI